MSDNLIKYCSILDKTLNLKWENIGEIHKKNTEIMEVFSEDRASLWELVLSAVNDTKLSSMFESDEFRVKLVLREGRYARLRLHLWHAPEEMAMIHNHRFDFTSMLLEGRRKRSLFRTSQDLRSKEALMMQNGEYRDSDELISRVIDVTKIQEVFTYEEKNHAVYTQESECLSNTSAKAGTLSLFIRGPAYHDSAFQWYPGDQKIIWKKGQANSTEAQREALTICKEDLPKILASFKSSILGTNDVNVA